MTVYPEIHITKVRDGKPRWWRVVRPVQCQDYDGEEYVIPAGFVSNFASLPPVLYPFISPHGRSAIPAIKHDYRYERLIGAYRKGSHYEARKAADRQFYLDLRQEGMGRGGAWLLYAGVRLLGGYPWHKHVRNLVLKNNPEYAGLHY